MIAYEDLVVALTNWRIQQGLETTALQFSSRSGSVNLDLPVADPEVLSEEIVEMDAVEEIEEEIEEVIDSSLLDSEQPAGEILYDDGEHTSIAEPGSFAEEDLDASSPEYADDDTQYVEESQATSDGSGDSAEYAEDADEVAVLEAEEILEESDSVAEPLESAELEVEEEIVEAAELEVEEEIVEAAELQVEEEIVEAAELEVEEEIVEAAELQVEEEIVEAAELQVEEEIVEAAELEVEEEISDGDTVIAASEVSPSENASEEFEGGERTMMGMGTDINLATEDDAGLATRIEAPESSEDAGLATRIEVPESSEDAGLATRIVVPESND